jgi:hypothetical protein
MRLLSIRIDATNRDSVDYANLMRSRAPLQRNSEQRFAQPRLSRSKERRPRLCFGGRWINSRELRMQPYFILVREPKGLSGARSRPFDRTRYAGLLWRAGARLFDIYPVSGHFDQMLFCLADNDDPIQKVVNKLERYEVTARVLANNCGNHWGTIQQKGKTENLSASKTKHAYNLVDADDRLTLSEMLATMARKRL